MNMAFRRVLLFRTRDNCYQSLTSLAYQKDLETCAQLLRQSPAFRDCLDPFLPQTWEKLLAEKRLLLSLIEETDYAESDDGASPLTGRAVGFRATCFISEKFYRETVYRARNRTLEPFVCRQLFEQHERLKEAPGRSPILTRSQVALANGREERDGLYLYTFSCHLDRVLETMESTWAFSIAVTAAVSDVTKGYWLSGYLGEHHSQQGKQHLINGGFEVLDLQYGRQSAVPDEYRLFLAHVDRDLLQQPGFVGTTAYNATTVYRPLLPLTVRQRELLEFALEGASDSVLADHYQTSEDAIRKRFSQIFQAVRESLPGRLKKGAERASLLSYLKDHYQEVRPYAFDRD